MSISQVILLIIVIAGFSIMFWLLSRKKEKDTGQDDKLKEMHEELSNIKDEMKGSLEKNLEFIQKQSAQTSSILQRQSADTSKIVQDVTSKLEKLEATNKQVVGFADQLQNLQDILKNPKQRGILGEYYLETILKNILPPSSYQMQYKFKDGEIVDAVIFIKDKIISIDSKFSLENYNRLAQEKDESRREQLEKNFKADLKMRIDETSKYIRPKEDTMDFAFMFIPAEGIYYDLLVSQVGAIKVNTRDLIEYAFKDRHVIIVSPTSFFAYLQTVMQGLRALQIEESAKEIRKRVEDLGKHLASYDAYLQKMGNNLSTTVNMYNTAYKEFGKIDKDVMRITEKERQIEVMQIEKPRMEE
ncbi:MAG: DNA recombination protein RmuC [Candidatus Kuenenbacteria bacterium]